MFRTLKAICFAFIILIISYATLTAQCPITVTFSPSTSTICSGNSVNLTATASSGSASYSWSPTTGLSNSLISNPIASPSATATYTVTALLQNGVEMVTNGTFESGNTGFSSNYTYVGAPSGTALWSEVTYAVASNPNAYHSNFPTFSDQTATAAAWTAFITASQACGTANGTWFKMEHTHGKSNSKQKQVRKEKWWLDM
jgi:hypothetical protein